MTKKEIIQETAKHYNLGNRSMTTYQTRFSDEQVTDCAYVGDNGKRCAFSRCCKDDVETLDKLRSREGNDANCILLEFGETVLKEEYRGHPNHFWLEIQGLHDSTSNWSETGLSRVGEMEVDDMLSKHCD